MPKIKYQFNDGTSCDVEVDDEFYNQYQLIEKKEKLVDRKETRRHVSLSAKLEGGSQFPSKEEDPLLIFIKHEGNMIFDSLSNTQKELLEAVYIDGKSIEEVAKIQGVNSNAIRQRMFRLMKHLKKLLNR